MTTLDEKIENEAVKERGTKFHMEGQHFFLTYPNLIDIQMSSSEYMEKTMFNLKQTFPQLNSAIIAWEHHKPNGQRDEIPHMHIALELHPNATKNKKWCFKSNAGMKKFDDLNPNGKHGDYRCCRSWQKSVNYLTKENNYIVHNLDVEAIKKSIKNKKGYTFEVVAKKCQAGATIKEIDKEYPQFVLQNQKKLQDYILLQESFKVEEYKEWFGVKPSSQSQPYETTVICEWLNNNIKKPRPHKQAQLYIVGEKNLGKTWLWNEYLSQYLKVYLVPNDKDWYDGYSDDHDLIVFDEFNGKTITWMNGFVEGCRFPVSRRGMLPYQKKKNIPVLVLSNKTPDDAFPNVAKEHPGQLEAFKCRFEVVFINQKIQIKPKEYLVQDVESPLSPQPIPMPMYDSPNHEKRKKILPPKLIQAPEYQEASKSRKKRKVQPPMWGLRPESPTQPKFTTIDQLYPEINK